MSFKPLSQSVTSGKTLEISSSAAIYSAIAAANPIPSQTSNGDKVLVTDGSSVSWQYAGLGAGSLGSNNVILGRSKPTGLTGTGNTIIGTGTTANALTTATDSIFIGYNNASNLTTNSSNVIIGNGITFDLNPSGSHRSVAIGNSVKVLGSNFTRDAVAIGHQSEVNPDSVSIGFQAKGPGSFAVAVGYQAESKSSYSVALGYRAKADGDSCVIGGDTSTNTYGSSLVVGTYASAGGPRSVSIGTGQIFERTSAGTEGIAIGHGAQALANSLGIGSEGAKINTVYLGRGSDTHWLNVPIVTGHPVKIMTMRGTGSNSDISAGTLTLAGSQSTGDKAGGDVIIATAPAGASGSSLNAHVERMRVTAAGNVGIGTTSPNVRLEVQNTTAATNTVTNVLRVDSQSSGTPAAGIGVGIQMSAETATGNTEVGVVLEAVTTDVTAASEDFDFVVKNMAAGAAATETLRVTSTGDTKVTGGNLSVETVGKGLKIKTGSNATAGKETGISSVSTVTINTTAVTANSLIFVQPMNSANTHGFTVDNIVAGTSFDVDFSGNYTGDLAWFIIEPA